MFTCLLQYCLLMKQALCSAQRLVQFNMVSSLSQVCMVNTSHWFSFVVFMFSCWSQTTRSLEPCGHSNPDTVLLRRLPDGEIHTSVTSQQKWGLSLNSHLWLSITVVYVCLHLLWWFLDIWHDLVWQQSDYSVTSKETHAPHRLLPQNVVVMCKHCCHQWPTASVWLASSCRVPVDTFRPIGSDQKQWVKSEYVSGDVTEGGKTDSLCYYPGQMLLWHLWDVTAWRNHFLFIIIKIIHTIIIVIRVWQVKQYLFSHLLTTA